MMRTMMNDDVDDKLEDLVDTIKTFHLDITRGAHTVLPPGTITDKTFDPHFEIYNFFNPFLIGPSLLTVTF